MCRYIIVLLFIVSHIQYVSAQIRGKVLDANNLSPLPGASLVYGTGEVTISDAEGVFRITPEEFPDTLLITYIGYEPQTVRISENTENLLIEMHATNYFLGEVQVTAFESRQNILSTPSGISLITRKELKMDNDVYIVPALNRVPGIYMHSGTYNTSRLTIRGIGSRSLFSTTKIRAYFDDIPLTSGDGETTIEDIDPNLIDRIEIIKGPSSSLYGAGLGGTLLIKPKVPTSIEKNVKYQFTGGSFGYIKNSIAADYGTMKHRINASINSIHSDGWRENNEFDRISAGITYKSYLNENTTLHLIGNLIDLKAFIPSSLNKSTFETNPESAAANWKAAEGFEDYTKFLGGFGIEHNFRNNSEISANVFWNHRNAYERRPFNNLHENTNATGTRIVYHYPLINNLWKIDLMAGTEYFLDFYDWQTYEIVDKEDGELLTDNQERRENLNVFIKTDISLPTQTFITIGLNVNRTHYTYEDLYSIDNEDNSGNYQFGTTFSPRLAISHPLSSKTNVYLNISHGFSPPTLAETLTPDGDINPDIQPESGINYEGGVKGLFFSNRLYVDLAVFSMRIRNLIVARRTAADQFVGVNAGKTTHNGLEVSLNYNFLQPDMTDRSFYAFITYTLADYTFKEFVDEGNDYAGNELTGIPGNVFNSGISFTSRAGLYGNLTYQFTDKIPVSDDNSTYTDPYQLVNGKLGYTFRLFEKLNLDVYGIVNNLFNEKYASMIMVNASSFGGAEPRYYYPGMPRNFYGGMEVTFEF